MHSFLVAALTNLPKHGGLQQSMHLLTALDAASPALFSSGLKSRCPPGCMLPSHSRGDPISWLSSRWLLVTRGLQPHHAGLWGQHPQSSLRRTCASLSPMCTPALSSPFSPLDTHEPENPVWSAHLKTFYLIIAAETFPPYRVAFTCPGTKTWYLSGAMVLPDKATQLEEMLWSTQILLEKVAVKSLS